MPCRFFFYRHLGGTGTRHLEMSAPVQAFRVCIGLLQPAQHKAQREQRERRWEKMSLCMQRWGHSKKEPITQGNGRYTGNNAGLPLASTTAGSLGMRSSRGGAGGAGQISVSCSRPSQTAAAARLCREPQRRAAPTRLLLSQLTLSPVSLLVTPRRKCRRTGSPCAQARLAALGLSPEAHSNSADAAVPVLAPANGPFRWSQGRQGSFVPSATIFFTHNMNVCHGESSPNLHHGQLDPTPCPQSVFIPKAEARLSSVTPGPSSHHTHHPSPEPRATVQFAKQQPLRAAPFLHPLRTQGCVSW